MDPSAAPQSTAFRRFPIAFIIAIQEGSTSADLDYLDGEGPSSEDLASAFDATSFWALFVEARR